MANIYYQEDCNLSLLEGKTIAVIGYGSQGHAHALNAKESGCHVIIGLYEGSKSWAKAEAQGFKVYTSAEYGFTTNEFDGCILTFQDYFDSGTFNTKTGKVECSDQSVVTYYFGEAMSDHMKYTLYVPAQIMPDMSLELSNGEVFGFLTNDTWKAGHSYTYSLKPVRNKLEVMSTSITPWTVESETTINGYE